MQSPPQTSPGVADILSGLPSDDFEAPPPPRPGWVRWTLRALVLLGVLAGAVYGFARLGGGYAATESEGMLTHNVARGNLVVTVVEDGNLESAGNLDIKCEVAGGSTILWIVEDGKEVAEGEVLVRLDSAQLEEQINQQKIVYEKARASHIQAEKDFAVAKIAVQEYIEGTYRQEAEKLDANVTIAMANLRSAENTLQHTERMFRKGYVSPLQLETQQFAVERTKLDLAAAKTAKDVLEKFTRAKTVEDLQSKRDTAEAKKNSEKAALDLEELRLKKLEAQLQKCVIKAPKAGMVIFANDTNRGRFGSPQQGAEIKEGAQVREQQTILRLPDLSRMQVKVTVHESKVERLRRGMRARVRIQDREFQGSVFSVANQPEPTSFFSAAVKEYATLVRVEGESRELRPGMTAEVEILLANVEDALTVPVAAVNEIGGQAVAFVRKGDRVERRTLVLGQSNDKFIEIKDGVAAGEAVVINPRTVLAEARGETRVAEAIDVQKRFGSNGAPLAGGEPKGAGPALPAGPAGTKMPPGPEPAGPLSGGPLSGGPSSGGPLSGGPTRGDAAGGDGPRGDGDAPRGEGPPPAARRGGMDLMQLDKDGDKRISREEAPERMQGFFDRLDGNGDGFIDAAEIAQMRARRAAEGDKARGPSER